MPSGFASWEDWLRRHGVPEEEWDDSAYLAGPGPTLSFLEVPEKKVVENRLHIGIKAGGRDLPWERRWPRVLAEVDRLTAAGATTFVRQDDGADGRGDHILLADQEGNEFCVV